MGKKYHKNIHDTVNVVTSDNLINHPSMFRHISDPVLFITNSVLKILYVASATALS